MALRLYFYFWVVLFDSLQNISTHFFAWPSMSLTMKRQCLSQVFLELQLLVNFPQLQQKFWIRTNFYNYPQYFCLFDILFECNPNNLVKERCRLSKSTPFISTFQVGLMFCFLVLFLGWQISILNSKLFPNRTSLELSRIVFPTVVVPKDDRTDVVQEERLDLPRWTMILAICALVDVSKYLGILTLEFSITLVHLPFWPASKWILHQLLDLNILEVWK